ncbi:hypothetical protein M9458_026462, partial [Cirrhinus mrigala]
ASSVHESVPEASPIQEFAPMPPEVAAPAAEPPKEAVSSYALSAHVTAKEAYHELTACHVTAKEAKEAKENYELSALLWMSFVPLWISLLLSALPALSVPPWLPVLPALPAPPWLPALPAPPWLPALPVPPWLPALPAPPWLQAPLNQTWWTIAPVLHCLPLLHGPGPPSFHCLLLLHGPGPLRFHCLPLFRGPGPPVLHCLSLLHDPGPPPQHGPGPPSHPLFCLCSPTLLDCCFEHQESLLWGGFCKATPAEGALTY